MRKFTTLFLALFLALPVHASFVSNGVVGPSSSVDAELVLFSSTSGKVIKRSSGTGFVKVTSGVVTAAALAGADLPNPSASSLGGVQSKAAVASQWLNAISTSGVPSSSQPTVADVTGAAPLASPTFTGTVTSSTMVLTDELTIKSSVTGLNRIKGGAAVTNLGNDATTTFVLGSNAVGILMVTQNTNGHSCLFFVHAGASPGISILSDPNSVFSTTLTTASKTNVSNPSQAGTITVENKLGTTKSYTISFWRNG